MGASTLATTATIKTPTRPPKRHRRGTWNISGYLPRNPWGPNLFRHGSGSNTHGAIAESERYIECKPLKHPYSSVNEDFLIPLPGRGAQRALTPRSL